MCHPHVPWPTLLPTVLYGLRTTYKEDLGASPAELLFGTTLQIPGLFFTTQDVPADPHTFVGRLREHFQFMSPPPTSDHVKSKHFYHKDLSTCTQVFRRVDVVKPPLTPSYTGPHRVLQRLDDKRFVIDIDGVLKTLSTESLKPAYTSADEPGPPTQQSQPTQ